MGIRTDPGYSLYIADNPTFPAGITPKKIFVIIAGVVFDYEIVPYPGKTMNGAYICEADGEYSWTYTAGDGSYVNLWLGGLGAAIVAVNEKGVHPFEWHGAAADGGGANEMAWPGNWISGGRGIFTSREPSLQHALQQTCFDTGITKAKTTFAEISTAEDGSLITRLARVSDATMIYVKRTPGLLT